MNSEQLTVATTTDPASVAKAVATDSEAGTRAPAPKFEVENLDGSSAVSYEHERSERTLLLERLAEHEKDLKELERGETDPERIASSEVQEADGEEQARTEEETAAEREQVGREGHYRQQTQQHFATPEAAQQAINQLRSELAVPFQARVAEITKDIDVKELATQAHANGPDISDDVRDVLLALHAQGGPEAAVYLAQHPEDRRALSNMPPDVAAVKVAQLAGRLAGEGRAVKAPITSAKPLTTTPAPITPVRGSSTKSSVPLDQKPYQEYRRIRDQQDKARFRK